MHGSPSYPKPYVSSCTYIEEAPIVGELFFNSTYMYKLICNVQLTSLQESTKTCIKAACIHLDMQLITVVVLYTSPVSHE